MKHPPEEITWHHGCPNTSMLDPAIQPGFEHYMKLTQPHLSLHMNVNAPHYTSKETRITFDNFAKQIAR